jgi:uncharacterized membrane-anchored protein YhcB (DUF1043 family)
MQNIIIGAVVGAIIGYLLFTRVFKAQAKNALTKAEQEGEHLKEKKNSSGQGEVYSAQREA